MKKNHKQVEFLVQQALHACSYDSVLADVRIYLNNALQVLYKVDKRRQTNLATQKAFEEGKNKHNEWWEMLKKNATKNFDDGNLEE